MKKPFLFFIALSASFAGLCQAPSQNASADFKKLQWLVGNWNRTSVKPGKSGFEEWKRINEYELSGRGISMTGTDTTFIEKIGMIMKDNHIYYTADVPENKSVVFFKITELTPNGFTCENPDHDFPKKIVYKLEGNKMTAVISGDGKSIPYTFERK